MWRRSGRNTARETSLYTDGIGGTDEILAYVGARSRSGARRIERRLQAVFIDLQRNPLMGRSTLDGQLRRFSTAPLPYIVFYEATEGEIIVVGIHHSARDPSVMPGRI